MLVRATSRNPKSQGNSKAQKNGIDLTARLDRVSPYQCVLAKISLAGRRSAEPGLPPGFGHVAWGLPGAWIFDLGSWALGAGDDCRTFNVLVTRHCCPTSDV